MCVSQEVSVNLKWGGRARGHDWSGIGGMVPNTWFPGLWCHSICFVPDIIVSRSALCSLLWCVWMAVCVSVPMMSEWQLLKHLLSIKVGLLNLSPPIISPDACAEHPPPFSVFYSKCMTVIFCSDIFPDVLICILMIITIITTTIALRLELTWAII